MRSVVLFTYPEGKPCNPKATFLVFYEMERKIHLGISCILPPRNQECQRKIHLIENVMRRKARKVKTWQVKAG